MPLIKNIIAFCYKSTLFTCVTSICFFIFTFRCFFAQEKCKDPSLTVLYPGHCVTSSPAPIVNVTIDNTYNDTKVPVTDIPPDPILAAFCANKHDIVCPDELDPVCGTDNKFYKNKYVSFITSPVVNLVNSQTCVKGRSE